MRIFNTPNGTPTLSRNSVERGVWQTYDGLSYSLKLKNITYEFSLEGNSSFKIDKPTIYSALQNTAGSKGGNIYLILNFSAMSVNPIPKTHLPTFIADSTAIVNINVGGTIIQNLYYALLDNTTYNINIHISSSHLDNTGLAIIGGQTIGITLQYAHPAFTFNGETPVTNTLISYHYKPDKNTIYSEVSDVFQFNVSPVGENNSLNYYIEKYASVIDPA